MTDLRDKAKLIAIDAVNRFRNQRGVRSKIAKALDLNHQTISLWRTVPLEHVFAVAAIVRLPAEQIRPDYFLDDPLRAQRAAVFVAQHPGTVTPRRRQGRLTEQARAVWLDPSIKSYKAATRALGHIITARTLLDHFGPRGPALRKVV